MDTRTSALAVQEAAEALTAACIAHAERHYAGQGTAIERILHSIWSADPHTTADFQDLINRLDAPGRA